MVHGDNLAPWGDHGAVLDGHQSHVLIQETGNILSNMSADNDDMWTDSEPTKT